jgi:hypothetical protein
VALGRVAWVLGVTAEVIDFGAPVALLGRCPGCQAPPRPLWERNGVRRCAACWAKAAAPRVVQFASAARPAPCRWTLPYPVGSRAGGGVNVNHQYRPNGRGGRVLSDVAATFRDEVIVLVRSSRAVVPDGRLGLRLRLVPPDARRRDADGPIKLTQDSIAAALGIDDARIAAVAVERLDPDPAAPRIEAELMALSTERR